MQLRRWFSVHSRLSSVLTMRLKEFGLTVALDVELLRVTVLAVS